MKLRLTPSVKIKGGVIDIDADLFAVGRKELCFAVFPEEDLATLSVRHAQIYCEKQRLFVVDLGSEQGTRINDRLLEDHPERLRDNDILTFGSLSFKVRNGEEPLNQQQDQTQFVSDEGDTTEILQSGSTRHIDSSKAAETVSRVVEESANDDSLLTEVLGVDSGVGSGVDVTRIHGLGRQGVNQPLSRLAAGSQVESGTGSLGKKIAFAVSSLLLLFALGAALWYASIPAQEEVADLIEIDPFKEALSLMSATLANGGETTLPAKLVALEGQGGTSANFDQLLEEASQYSRMLYLRDNQNLLALLKIRSTQTFHSLALEQAAVAQLDSVLRPADYFEAMQRAEELWKSGQLIEAINLTSQWSGEADSALAKAMLRRFTLIVEEYETLTTLNGTATFAQRALAFYFDLDPIVDQFFWVRLARDFAGVSQRETVVAAEHLENAGALWRNYQKAGGIDWRMRQNRQITPVFSQRARQLRQMANALAAASAGVVGQVVQQSAARTLPALLEREISWQREMLKALKLATEDTLYSEKIALLPSSGLIRPGASGSATQASK